MNNLITRRALACAFTARNNSRRHASFRPAKDRHQARLDHRRRRAGPLCRRRPRLQGARRGGLERPHRGSALSQPAARRREADARGHAARHGRCRRHHQCGGRPDRAGLPAQRHAVPLRATRRRPSAVLDGPVGHEAPAAAGKQGHQAARLHGGRLPQHDQQRPAGREARRTSRA